MYYNSPTLHKPTQTHPISAIVISDSDKYAMASWIASSVRTILARLVLHISCDGFIKRTVRSLWRIGAVWLALRR